MKIQLPNGLLTIIDKEDFDLVSEYTWYAFNNGYNNYVATKLPNGKHIYLHRLLLDAPDNLQVDHINKDTLDNRKVNLRLATNQQNNINKSVTRRSKTGIKGVSYYPNERRKKKYLARIGINYKTINLGWYMTAEEAHKAYKQAARNSFGEFARV